MSIVKRWGRRALVSLAFAITAARIYPTVKYALGHGKACMRVVVGGTPVMFDHGRAPASTRCGGAHGVSSPSAHVESRRQLRAVSPAPARSRIPHARSMADAEDAVQEAYLRWHATDRDKVSDPRAFLMTTTTRICLDMLTSARARREEYVGPVAAGAGSRYGSPRARQPHGTGRGFVHRAAVDARSVVAARAGRFSAARRVRFLVQRSRQRAGAERGRVPTACGPRTRARARRTAARRRPRRRRDRARSTRSTRSSCPRSWRQRAPAISMR